MADLVDPGELVDLAGFEPATFTMPWCCATGLRYRPEFAQVTSSPSRLERVADQTHVPHDNERV